VTEQPERRGRRVGQAIAFFVERMEPMDIDPQLGDVVGRGAAQVGLGHHHVEPDEAVGDRRDLLGAAQAHAAEHVTLVLERVGHQLFGAHPALARHVEELFEGDAVALTERRLHGEEDEVVETIEPPAPADADAVGLRVEDRDRDRLAVQVGAPELAVRRLAETEQAAVAGARERVDHEVARAQQHG
jgi:hypothetical protein